MNWSLYAGVAAVLLLICGIGIWSGRQIKSGGDFSGGGRSAGAGIVVGTIVGTLVGGSSTIGTAQLAFSYGFSAWWFTLGGGIGCLVLTLVYAKPLYNSGCLTLPQIFKEEYGSRVATVATIMTTVGSFLSIVSQILSGTALLSSVWGMGAMLSALLIVLLMLFYVFFGGVWGAGKAGIAKTVLLCIGVGLCGVIAIVKQGGLGAFAAALPHDRYFSLFARGIPTDLGAGLSLVVGLLTTQTYIQAVISAKSLKIGKKGAIWSAVLIPVIGVAGIYVGLYMRLHYPDMNAASALPAFILEQLPPFAAGIVLATLLVALVGTGAGLSLGISAMVSRDVYHAYIRRDASEKQLLLVSRLVILVILAFAMLFSMGNMGSLIISWSFMSMGLRGAVAFGPLCAALFMKGKVPANYVFVAMIAGPLATLASKFLIAGIDPLFPGMAMQLLVMFAGYLARKNRQEPSADKKCIL